MKTLSKWLIATAISIFSFLFLLMLASGATSTNSTDAIPACRGDMLLDWFERRLEYTQRKRLRKLIHNLIEIVYVNALFALIMLIMLLPFIILSCQAITLQDQLAIAMHHLTDASDPTAVQQPVLRDVCILDV